MSDGGREVGSVLLQYVVDHAKPDFNIDTTYLPAYLCT